MHYFLYYLTMDSPNGCDSGTCYDGFYPWRWLNVHFSTFGSLSTDFHPRELGLLRDPVALVYARSISDEYDLNHVGGLIFLEPLHPHCTSSHRHHEAPTPQRFVANNYSFVGMIGRGELLQISIGTSHISIVNVESCTNYYFIMFTHQN